MIALFEIAIGIAAGVLAELAYLAGRAFVVCFRYGVDMQRRLGRTLTQNERRALVKQLQERGEL